MRTISWGKVGEPGAPVKPSALSPPDKHPHDSVTFSSMLAEYDGCIWQFACMFPCMCFYVHL